VVAAGAGEDDGRVRTKVAAVAVAAGACLAFAVVALASSSANGLPAYTDGYARWTKLNRKPVTTPGAHNGVKNVYASKPRGANRRFPDGTVIVKSIAEPGAKGLAAHVAVMRKTSGRWQWVEYSLAGSRYQVLARGQLCVDCHMRAKATDWVFTKR
jgi:hypothetical protein